MNQYQESPCADGCRQRPNDPLEGMEVAMAYVPWQHFSTIYEPDKALMVGTIFPELNRPFLGASCSCKGGGMRR